MDFGQLLIEKGLIDPRQLEEALAEQRRCIVQGRHPVPRLGEILVSRGFLTERQVTEALQSQNKAILFCPRCNVQVNVDLREDAAGYRCGTCQADLEQPAELRNVQVADTSVMLVSRAPLPAEVQEAFKEPARKFGKYVLLEEIGRGGAAIVHRAWDTYLSQYVALKFLKSSPEKPLVERDAKRESRILELLEEARSTIRLRHPNIVTIYDVGRLEKQFYIAMDCLEGRSMSAHIRAARERGKISPLYDDPKRFVSALRDSCRALHYAHTRQTPVIHCDLKPSNIFLDSGGKAYVLDFGLARRLAGEELPENLLPGTVRGTPSYMAPEQASGKPEEIDARTDVYGMGAILYELLVGRPPFSGEILTILRKVVHEAPEPPGEILRFARETGLCSEDSVGPALERICMKALQKNKSLRYQTVREMADDFDRVLRGDRAPQAKASTSRRAAAPPATPAPAAPAPEGWRSAVRRHRFGLAATVLGAAALLLVVIFAPPSSGEATLMQRVDRLTAALQLEQSRAVLTESASLAPSESQWLQNAREEIGWLIVMRDHFAEAINRKGFRYAPDTLKLRDGRLRGVRIIWVTPEHLVAGQDGGDLRIPWTALDPEELIRMLSTVLIGANGGDPTDRLALGIYCAKCGFSDRARPLLQSLQGTDLEPVASRYLSNLK